VKESSKPFTVLNEFPTVQTLTAALNQIGATTRDIMIILQSIKAAGALQAELVVL
jgi:flagellar P-ring protein precursor FlgI